MTQKHDIRRMYFDEGKKVSEISRVTGRDRKTIRKFVQDEDWNAEVPKVEQGGNYPKLNPYKDEIEENEEGRGFRKRRRQPSLGA